jgi:hypothetical protein
MSNCIGGRLCKDGRPVRLMGMYSHGRLLGTAAPELQSPAPLPAGQACRAWCRAPTSPPRPSCPCPCHALCLHALCPCPSRHRHGHQSHGRSRHGHAHPQAFCKQEKVCRFTPSWTLALLQLLWVSLTCCWVLPKGSFPIRRGRNRVSCRVSCRYK